MSRRAAVQVADELVDQCLLCGGDATTYADLCDTCAGVVQATADRVAASYRLHVFRSPWCGAKASEGVAPEAGVTCPACQPAPAAGQVPGQLELEEGETIILPLDQDPVRLGGLLAALGVGDLRGVDTMTMADATSEAHRGMFTVTEMDLIKGELWRRA